MLRKWVGAALAGLSLALMAACSTGPTPYQPLRPDAKAQGGFSQTKIDADRWRVSFSGNTVTDKATVEDYLLYRAAELTLEQGFDWFSAVKRGGESTKRSIVTPDGPYYGWAPYWRGYYRGGWRAYDPWGRDLDVDEIKSFEADVEIVLGKGEKPKGDLNAYTAREVVANLGPHIKRPQPSR